MPGNPVASALRAGLFTRLVGQRLLFFQELPSTMDEAARQARSGAQEGTVVVAKTQTAGRGRFGREWVSQEGNLYLSVLLRPASEQLAYLNCLAGLAAVRAVRKATGLTPRLKWPNDVIIEGKKVAGVLIESSVTGGRVDYAVVGVGVNVSLDPAGFGEIAPFATSLKLAAQREVKREEVLRHLLQEMDGLYLALGRGESPVPEWKEALDTLGRSVRVDWQGETYQGVAEDVDESGNLLLRLTGGRLATLTAGDVTLQEYVPSGDGEKVC